MNRVTVKKFVGTTPEALETLAAYIESELNAGATIRQVASLPSGAANPAQCIASARHGGHSGIHYKG